MKKTIFFLLTFLIAPGLANGQLVINEIMYNSDGTDVEYVELVNTSGSELNLSDWYLLDDNDAHDHCNLSGILGAGEYLVVAGDMTMFNAQYPAVTNVNPNYFNLNGNGWSLGNGGDIVRLFDNSDQLHDQVNYSDGGDWPGSADGGGPSLELFNPLLDNELPTSWDPSDDDWGTPGEQNSVYTLNVVPTCKDGSRDIGLPTSADNITVTVIAYDSEGLDRVELSLNTGAGYVTQPMFDNGQNGDSVAGDSVYTAIIPSQVTGTLVKYYAMATDDIGQSDNWPNSAPAEYHAYTVDYVPSDLRITEVLAVNDTGIQDGSGEYDDWFEIYNADDDAVNLSGMYVSDQLNSNRMYELPAITLNSGTYLLLWADNDTEQGSLHTNFRLTSGGESIAIFETVDHGNELIHGWKFGLMSPDVSMGFPEMDATAPEYLSQPTPGASNGTSPLFSSVCINEFLTTSNFGGYDDWVEIYNRGNASFDLSGCFLSDERGNNTKWTFPANTVLDPGEFLAIYEDDDALQFGFSSDGIDVIMLTAADSTTGLDFYDFGPQDADRSEGRYPDGASIWGQLSELTDGETNSSITGVTDHTNIQPVAFALFQNYPNPFNPETTVVFELPLSGKTNIRIYNMLGREIVTLVNKNLTADRHEAKWNGLDKLGRQVGSGIYFYRIESGDFSATKRMILLR